MEIKLTDSVSIKWLSLDEIIEHRNLIDKDIMWLSGVTPCKEQVHLLSLLKSFRKILD